jgi:hypothetical protein
MKNIETGDDVPVGSGESISCVAKLLTQIGRQSPRHGPALQLVARAVSVHQGHGGEVLASGQLTAAAV